MGNKLLLVLAAGFFTSAVFAAQQQEEEKKGSALATSEMNDGLADEEFYASNPTATEEEIEIRRAMIYDGLTQQDIDNYKDFIASPEWGILYMDRLRSEPMLELFKSKGKDFFTKENLAAQKQWWEDLMSEYSAEQAARKALLSPAQQALERVENYMGLPFQADSIRSESDLTALDLKNYEAFMASPKRGDWTDDIRLLDKLDACKYLRLNGLWTPENSTGNSHYIPVIKLFRDEEVRMKSKFPGDSKNDAIESYFAELYGAMKAAAEKGYDVGGVGEGQIDGYGKTGWVSNPWTLEKISKPLLEKYDLEASSNKRNIPISQLFVGERSRLDDKFPSKSRINDVVKYLNDLYKELEDVAEKGQVDDSGKQGRVSNAWTLEKISKPLLEKYGLN